MKARLSNKLSDYMIEKMHRGQTGFVTAQGILVNQMRLVRDVMDRMNKDLKAFRVFVDFSNAYNTILHTK